ncbi:MAG TPA: hypothetical protein VNO32_29160 [Candidatus Acidoferrum sp.]|nr:hypothetical protein [Candidatus Acidoferrum sp.]
MKIKLDRSDDEHDQLIACSISVLTAGACLRDLTFRFQASIGCLGPTPGGAFSGARVDQN